MIGEAGLGSAQILLLVLIVELLLATALAWNRIVLTHVHRLIASSGATHRTLLLFIA